MFVRTDKFFATKIFGLHGKHKKGRIEHDILPDIDCEYNWFNIKP